MPALAWLHTAWGAPRHTAGSEEGRDPLPAASPWAAPWLPVLGSGQRLSHGAPVPRGWPGPGSPSSAAAMLNQMGPAVPAGHAGLTQAASSLTPYTLCPGDSLTLPDPLPAPGSLLARPRGSHESLLSASHEEG